MSVSTARIDNALLTRIQSVISSIRPDDKIGCVNVTLCVRPYGDHPSVLALHCCGAAGTPDAETTEHVLQLLYRHNITGLWSGIDGDAIYVRVSETACVPPPADVRAITRAVGNAFDSLDKQGLSTFTELAACPECEEQVLLELVEAQDVPTHGFVYYRESDADDLDTTGTLLLRFGAFHATSETPARLVGGRIVTALEYHGLIVDWDGDVNHCIAVRLPVEYTNGIPAPLNCDCNPDCSHVCNYCCDRDEGDSSGDCTNPNYCDECISMARCWDCENCSNCLLCER